MPKIKEVYEYSNGSWANGTPIGADASNVDVALSDSTSTRDLQTVLGNVSVSDPSMKTQLTGKVNASGGDIKDTVVSVLDPASETDTSEDINSTDVVVAAGESQTTMWSKFNMFRKRVSNKFSNFLISSVEDVVTPSDTKTYSQAALNSYFADVIGYKTDADVATVGSVADQLSTLNNNVTRLNAQVHNYYFTVLQIPNVTLPAGSKTSPARKTINLAPYLPAQSSIYVLDAYLGSYKLPYITADTHTSVRGAETTSIILESTTGAWSTAILYLVVLQAVNVQ